MKKVGAILDKTLPDPREVALLERMPVELRTIPINLLLLSFGLANYGVNNDCKNTTHFSSRRQCFV